MILSFVFLVFFTNAKEDAKNFAYFDGKNVYVFNNDKKQKKSKLLKLKSDEVFYLDDKYEIAPKFKIHGNLIFFNTTSKHFKCIDFNSNLKFSSKINAISRSEIIIKDKFAYFHSIDNEFYCYNLSGKLIWYSDSFFSKNPIKFYVDDSFLYVFSADAFFILDKRTGKILKQIAYEEIYNGFNVQNDCVIIYAKDKFIKINLKNFKHTFFNNVLIFNDIEYLILNEFITLKENFSCDFNYRFGLFNNILFGYRNVNCGVAIIYLNSNGVNEFVIKKFEVSKCFFKKGKFLLIDEKRNKYKIL